MSELRVPISLGTPKVPMPGSTPLGRPPGPPGFTLSTLFPPFPPPPTTMRVTPGTGPET